jgi:HPt (histidine-containing phosphotransfer) domain-containing protein
LDAAENNVAMIKDWLLIYERTLPRLLDDLAEALRHGDLEPVAEKAHRIRGVSNNVGARRLGTAAADLERAATRGNLANGPDRLRQLQEHFAAFQTALAAVDWNGVLFRNEPLTETLRSPGFKEDETRHRCSTR